LVRNANDAACDRASAKAGAKNLNQRLSLVPVCRVVPEHNDQTRLKPAGERILRGVRKAAGDKQQFTRNAVPRQVYLLQQTVVAEPFLDLRGQWPAITGDDSRLERPIPLEGTGRGGLNHEGSATNRQALYQQLIEPPDVHLACGIAARARDIDGQPECFRPCGSAFRPNASRRLVDRLDNANQLPLAHLGTELLDAVDAYLERWHFPLCQRHPRGERGNALELAQAESDAYQRKEPREVDVIERSEGTKGIPTHARS